MLTDKEVDEKLAASTGSRVTKEMIEERIAHVDYMRLWSVDCPMVTICNIRLDNGYSVRGESACVDPANFDAAVGERIAYDNAFDKLWPLFGFMLMEKRHERGVIDAALVKAFGEGATV